MSPAHFDVIEHVVPAQYIREYPGALLDDQEDTLQLHIKQYKPKGDASRKHGGVTIVGAHANAFPKELYEPLWDNLYQALKERDQSIQSIWIADIANQGMSGILNEHQLGNDPAWNDHPRDLLHMINNFRKEMPRPLIGIGHSVGGNHLVQLSNIHPRLLSSVILIDPVIHNASEANTYPNADTNFARASTFRRDLWPSRAEAARSFKKSKVFQAWDPRVLDLWVQYGLRNLPTAIYPERTGSSDKSKASEEEDLPVTLSTNKHQEVFMYLRPNFEGRDGSGKPIVDRQTHPDVDLTTTETFPFYRPEPPAVFKRLPNFRASALYVFGGTSELSQPKARQQKLDITGIGVGGSGGVKDGRVKEIVIDDAGHLIPMTHPKDCADAAAVYIANELNRWRTQEDLWKKQWKAQTKAEKTMLSEEWKTRLGGDPRLKPTQKL